MKPDKIYISVIIPYKKNLIQLEDALNSVPCHDYIETIVIDDYSHENESTSLIIDKYPWIRFIENKSINRGAGSARNIGIELANGRWIFFLDSDDCIDTIKFDKIIPYLLQNHNKDCIFFKADTKYRINANEFNPRHQHLNCAVDKFIINNCEFGLRFEVPVPWGKFISRDFILGNKIRFDSTIHANDVMFSLMVGRLARNISAINEVIYFVTRSNDSLTTNRAEFAALQRLEVLIRSNIYCIEYNIPRKFQNGLLFVLNTRPWKITMDKVYLYCAFVKMHILKIQAKKIRNNL